MKRIALAQEEPQKRVSHVPMCRCPLCVLLSMTVDATPALLQVALEEQETRLLEILLQTMLLPETPFALLQLLIGFA